VTEKAFRLDFVIAIAALLVSAMSAFALIYQTRVIGQQYAATIWPYLSVSSTYDLHGVLIQVANDGLGPALVGSAQLMVDDKPVSSWATYTRFVTGPAIRLKPGGASISASSFGPGDTIRPGDTKLLFAIRYRNVVQRTVLTSHAVGIRLCYCSINNSCWNIVATPGKDNRTVPEPVSSCTENSAISSDLR
jgi:hypothetical protein